MLHLMITRFSANLILSLLLFVLSLSFPGMTQESEPDIPVFDGTLRRIRVPILMYHYISPLPEEADDIRVGLTVEPDIFRAHLQYLKEQGYTTISLYDLDAALLNGMPLPSKPVILTFDDGYADHYTTAFPMLQEFGFTGTFFIITARADVHDPAHVSWAQIAEMAEAGMDMESHTKNHPDLRERERDFLVYQILGSLESLAAFTDRVPHMFAYPVGRYDAETLAVLTELPVWRAVTTEPGALHSSDNRLLLPRVRVLGNMGVAALASVLETG